MNILHLSTYLQGGAGLAIRELACEQMRAGHSVCVALSGSSEGDCGNEEAHLSHLAASGIPVLTEGSTFKRELSSLVDTVSRLGARIADFNPDVFHTHAAVPSLIAITLRSSVTDAAPIVQTMHGWGIRKTPEQTRTDIQIMNLLDIVVPVSEALAHKLQDLGLRSDLIRVVPNGTPDLPVRSEIPDVDPDVSDAIARWRSEDLQVLLCVGEVTQRKNQRFLLRCLKMDPLKPGTACLFLGDGEDLAELTQTAESSVISGRVCFAGYRENAWRFLTHADWLVLPSLDEGMPMAILEAFRAGVPVLGSKIPEIAELVHPGRTGLLFDPLSETECCEVLQEAMRLSPSGRAAMGRNARADWERQHQIAAMASGYARIYSSLGMPPRRPSPTRLPAGQQAVNGESDDA